LEIRATLHGVTVKGVLRTPPPEAFRLHRFAPSPALAPFAVHRWVVEHDLDAPHRQVTLGHPSAHLVVEDGAATIWGPRRTRWERVLEGRGRAVAIRFRPGGLRPLLDRPLSALADRTVPFPGLDVAAIEAELDPERASALLDAAVAARIGAAPTDAIALADRAVALLEHDRSITTVEHLARELTLSVRSTQRLFADHVGMGPAHVIRRYRLQEAAAVATAGGEIDWARLALELGYYDQAHLVRDFTAQVGTPPARYAASGSP
jgi:AraC-like DNA-binding protein